MGKGILGNREQEAVTATPAPAKHPLEDVLRRVVNEALNERLGQPVVSTKVISDDLKPILLKDEHRRAIEKMMGGIIINTPHDVVTAFMKLGTFNVKGISTPIVLPHDYLVRLESRVPIDTDCGAWVEEQFLRFVEMLVDGAL